MSEVHYSEVSNTKEVDDRNATLYEKRQYINCISRLGGQSEICTFTDQFIVRNNLLVAQIQKAYALCDSQSLSIHIKELNKFWLELSNLPFTRDLSVISLSCASNVVYSFFMHSTPNSEKSSFVGVAVQALESLTLYLGEIPISENSSSLCRFHQLGMTLVRNRNFSQIELSLILYTTLLISLMYNVKELQLLLKEFMNIFDSNETRQSNNLAMFLLSPADLPLILNQHNFHQTIYNLTSVIMAVNFCETSFWKEAQEMSKMQHQVLFPIMELVKLYSNLCGNINSSICQTKIDSENNEYIHFSTCLLHAAELAKEKKHSMAMEFIRIAIGGALGATKVCCIPVVCMALQFQHLGEAELEVQAWAVAEDILLNSPELPCRLHSETLGFLLQRMGLLRIPSIASVQYRLARSLLENKFYDRAVAVYDRLADASNGETTADGVSVWMGLPSLPVTQIINHERIFSLLSAKLFNRALDVIEQSPEDFVTLYLHAQVAISMKQKPKAMKLINRAILSLKQTSFHPIEMVRIIESKLHWKLAVLFNSIGNYQDALHQLRFAVQQNYLDTHLLEYYRDFVAKSGVKIAISESNATLKGDLNQIVDKFFQLNDDWAVRFILEPLNE